MINDYDYCPNFRTPSYRLLGGKLMDSMCMSSSSWRDETPVISGAAADQAATINILRYLTRNRSL